MSHLYRPSHFLQYLPKLTRYIPLWQRILPRHPMYLKGNPQLRLFLPLFWMRMIKLKENLPKDTITFEVHMQMTTYDVKNYLEKIYKVPVLSVRCELIRGEERTHPTYGFSIQPARDRRIAWVQVAEGYEFEFPELFKDKITDEETTAQEYKKAAVENKELSKTQWQVQDLPPWFR